MFKLLKKDKAFTLVEMLVSISIFSIIIGAATGVFVSAIKLQRYNLVHQQLLDQTSYAMEYMSRAIRMAQKDDDTCGFLGKNYNWTANSIEFQTYKSPTECWRFYKYCSGEVCQLKGGIVGSELPLTSPNFTVISLKFNVSGDGAGTQPKVTIFMEVQGKDPSPQPRIKIQTTISQRNM